MSRLAMLLAALGAALGPASEPRQAAASAAQGLTPASELARAAPHRSAEIPAGLDAGEWSSLRAAYDASRHAAQAVPDGFLAHNPDQRWSTRFGARGASTAPDAGGWSWGLELLRYGFAGDEVVVRAPLALCAAGPRVRYAWDATLEEWYVNDERGLEHGFTVRERPAWSGGGEPSALSFTLAVRGGLAPRVQPNGRDVSFVDAGGAPVLGYAGLVVLDADGRSLAAGFERVPEGLLLSIDERGARYPLTIDPVAQQAYLKASNTGPLDLFGFSVAISGNTVLIGAPEEDSSASGVNGDQSDNGARDSGAAYVFVRGPAGWSQEAYLKASNPGVCDRFGWAVSISGDTLVVGAPFESSSASGVNGDQTSNAAALSGAAYVFVRSGTSWSQEAYLKASNTGAGDQLGQAVSVSGDTLVVGAHGESSNASGVNGDQLDDNASGSGAAYVFVRTGTSWSQEAYLKASNSQARDQFGSSVSLSGDTLVIGALEEDSSASGVNGDGSDNGAPNSGAAYVFVRGGTSWSQEAYLKASNTGFLDSFGRSVSVQSGTIAVGAHSEAGGGNGDEGDNSAPGAGAAYVFARSGTVWSQESYLKASNTGSGDAFGISIALSEGTLVVGALWESSSASGVNGDQENDDALRSGAAYAYRVCSPARVVFRNAGSNPASYAAAPAVVGNTFTATVDNNLAGQTASLLFAFDTPTSFGLPGGQTLLCIDLGNGELLTGGNLFPASSAGGVDSYSLTIPSNPALGDLVVYSQALQFGNPPFALSNAQDLTIGAF